MSLKNAYSQLEYLPFGETLIEEHLNSYNSPYRFNAKELDEETGNYYYGARYYNPKFSLWLSVDPLAEKYPGWSPYNYTLNNPVRFTDPTGMGPEDIIIWYKDKNGKDQFFRYTGNNGQDAPDNEFVQSTLSAICFDTSNGGGQNIQKAANDRTTDYELIQGKGGTSSAYKVDGRRVVNWDDTGAMEVENGDVISPATILEHEFDHAVDRKENGSEHGKRVDNPDKNYKNAEEKRVIQGSETMTAKANGEISQDKPQSRYSHDANSVKVENSTSTKIVKRYE